MVRYALCSNTSHIDVDDFLAVVFRFSDKYKNHPCHIMLTLLRFLDTSPIFCRHAQNLPMPTIRHSYWPVDSPFFYPRSAPVNIDIEDGLDFCVQCAKRLGIVKMIKRCATA